MSQELEEFLQKVAPSNVTIERVEAATLDELSTKLQKCISQGNPLAYQ